MKTYIFYFKRETGAHAFYIQIGNSIHYRILEQSSNTEGWGDVEFEGAKDVKLLGDSWVVIFGKASSLKNFKEKYKSEIMLALL